MNENKAFEHFLMKIGERITFLFQYYIPQGKDLPESDRDLLLELYRLYDDGILDSLSREPMEEQPTSQGLLFTMLSMSVTTQEE